MSILRLLRLSLAILIPISIISTTYLYLYPIFNGCAFPVPNSSAATSFAATVRQHAGYADTATLAPFRLLTLADPQLEGDSSLPNPENAFIPSLRRHWSDIRAASSIAECVLRARDASRTVLQRDIPTALQATRKRIDLFGNDYYLAHIYRTLHWWSRPTHVTVLGDLIGSQWVTDEEFDWRGWRYWNRVFRHGTMVEEEIMEREEGKAREEDLGADSAWSHRIINILGNHDGGYAGDMTPERIDRFERVFGKANWDVKFNHRLQNTTTTPTLHIIVLNSLNLDTPVISQDLQAATYDFINKDIIGHSAAVEDRSTFTLLLTHLPLHKPEGVCVDAPFFDYYDGDQGNALKEQNHLSLHTSTHGILEGIFGMSANPAAPASGRGRNGIIFTGHDHEGCDTWHHIPSPVPAGDEESSESEPADKPWRSVHYTDRNRNQSSISTLETGIREITLRSMMGSYGGNAGLFSAWFNPDLGEWRFQIQMCSFGVQHWWWGVHILDMVTVLLGLGVAVREGLGGLWKRKTEVETRSGSEKKKGVDKSGLERRVGHGPGEGSVRKKRRKG